MNRIVKVVSVLILGVAAAGIWSKATAQSPSPSRNDSNVSNLTFIVYSAGAEMPIVRSDLLPSTNVRESTEGNFVRYEWIDSTNHPQKILITAGFSARTCDSSTPDINGNRRSNNRQPQAWENGNDNH